MTRRHFRDSLSVFSLAALSYDFCPFPKMNLIGSVFHTVLAFLMLFGLCFIIELLELSNVS